MNRTTKTVGALVAAAGLTVGTGAVAATAAPAQSGTQHVTQQDKTFLRSNEQVNLAEITLGTIALDRTKGPRAAELARVTKADHEKTMRANEAVARHTGVSLPSKPNAEQQQAAATLKQAYKVARTYFVAQIAGHKQSIAQTKTEIARGSNNAIVDYAKYYLPIAQKHLKMSEQDLAYFDKTH